MSITDANGCLSSNSCVTITVTPPLSVMTFGDSPICEGGTSNLSAFASGGDGGPYTYTWDQGIGVGQNQVISPVQSTDYTVTVTDGCESPAVSIATTVNVEPIPEISGIITDEMFGNDGMIDLFGVPLGSSIDWDNDGVGDFDDPEDLTGLVAGTYTVYTVSALGCLATATFVVGSQVGMEEMLNKGSFLIYPNPNSGSFSIELNNSSSIKSIKVVDLNGRIIFNKEKGFNPKEKIIIPEHISGIVHLTIQTDNGIYHKKIIVQP